MLTPRGTIVGRTSRAEYDAIDAVNFSTLKHAARSPAHYLKALTAKTSETDAMRLGTAVHAAVFEPLTYGDAVAIWDGGRRYGNPWDAFCAENAGRLVITTEQQESALAIQQAVQRSRFAELVAMGESEVTVVWQHVEEQTGEVPGLTVKCKGRLDFLSAAGCIVDLKTTRDASPEAFGRSGFNLQYHVQAALYSDGYTAATGRQLPYVLLAVENQPPYVVQAYELSGTELEMGRQEYRRLLRLVDGCRRSGKWPGYAESALPFQFPHWAYGATEESESELVFSTGSDANGF